MNLQRDSSQQVGRTLDSLVRTYTPALQRFFERRILEHADVDDLVQEVFLRLEQRGSLGDVINIEGYLFQTAANILRDRLRQRLTHRATDHRPLDANLAQDTAFAPDRILLGKDALDRFTLALQELPERTRTIFALNRFEEISYSAIAARLGVSVSTVEKQISRALEHLQTRLKDSL